MSIVICCIEILHNGVANGWDTFKKYDLPYTYIEDDSISYRDYFYKCDSEKTPGKDVINLYDDNGIHFYYDYKPKYANADDERIEMADSRVYDFIKGKGRLKEQKKDSPNHHLEEPKSMNIYNTPTTGDIINENMENSNNKNDDLSMLNLADVEPKEAKWLIKDFIPLEGITLLIGDGGVGKTFVWCDILSSLSNGTWTFFENNDYFDLHPRKPMKVMYFSSEDDTEVILQPRLSNMKADMSNIYTIEMKDERLLKITYDSELLNKLVDEFRPGLIVFDPLQSFVPDNVQMSSKNQMRRLLNHLNVICKQYHTTVIIVMHTNKREKAWGRNRASDTGDIWDIARSAFILGKTNDNPRTRYFSHEKSNYGIEQDTTLFEIADDGCVINVGTTTLKDKDYVQGSIYESRNKQPRADAKEFILECLNENNKRASRDDVKAYVLACGISQSAFERAISELKKNKRIKVLPSNDPNKKTNSKDYALSDVG